MLSHVMVGTSDFERAMIVHRPVFDALRQGSRGDVPPGLRPEKHAHRDGAPFRNRDGITFRIVSHQPG